MVFRISTTDYFKYFARVKNTIVCTITYNGFYTGSLVSLRTTYSVNIIITSKNIITHEKKPISYALF